MKKSKLRFANLLLAAVIGMSVFTACGSSPDSVSTEVKPAPSQNGDSAEKREDLVVCMQEDLATLDPINTSAIVTQAAHKLIYARLYVEDENYQPVPQLAKEFNVISDTEIDIKIHEGALFSDGTPITAEDVVYNLERALASPNFNTLMKAVEKFEVIDETTFKIVTKGPAPSIKQALMHSGASILPKTYVEKAIADDDWSSPICSGPFKFDSRNVGESVKVVKNDNFFDKEDMAQCNSITLKFVPEANSRTILVETGEADVNFAFATADYERAKKNSDLTVHETTGVVVQYVGVDTTMAPFDNVKVRQALNYAINREDVMAAVVEGLGTAAYTVIPPSVPGYLENPMGYTYDTEKAKSLLAEAGYADGFDTQLFAYNDLGKRTAEIVQAFLAEVGINAAIEVRDASVRVSTLANHQAPMFVGAWGAMSDADLVLPRLFTQEAIGGMNFTHYTNPKLDELFEKGRSTYDEAERKGYYEECVKILAEAAPWCPMYTGKTFALTRADLQGVQLDGECIINLHRLHY